MFSPISKFDIFTDLQTVYFRHELTLLLSKRIIICSNFYSRSFPDPCMKIELRIRILQSTNNSGSDQIQIRKHWYTVPYSIDADPNLLVSDSDATVHARNVETSFFLEANTFDLAFVPTEPLFFMILYPFITFEPVLFPLICIFLKLIHLLPFGS